VVLVSIVVINFLAPKVRGKYIDELLEELESLKSSNSASKLKNTIDKIGNLTDKKAIPPLTHFINHDTDYVRAAVITALQKIRNNKDLPRLLIEKLKTEQSNLVRTTIIEALGELEDIIAIPALEKIRDENSEDDRIKITAIFAIDRLTRGGLSALDQLVEYLVDSRNPNTRVEAAKALGKLGDPRAIKYLVDALDDEKVFVRKFIIKALVSFGDKQVVDPIIKVFTDEKVFIERDLIKVLWVFPEYENKELWQIIELRNQENKGELNLPENHPVPMTKNSENQTSKIKEDYAYETNLDTEPPKQSPKPPATQEPVSKGVPSQNPPAHDISSKMDLEKAKKELIPKLESTPAKGNAEDKQEVTQPPQSDLIFSDLFNKGERFYRKKQYYEAIINFKKAIDIKYDSWQAWYNMALVFYDIDEKEKSVECFLNALQFKPNEIDAMLNLSSLYNEMGEYNAAIQYLIIALNQYKFLPDAWLLLGKLFFKNRSNEFALHCFNQVLQISHEKRERGEARNFSERIMREHPALVPKDPLKEKIPGVEEKLRLDL